MIFPTCFGELWLVEIWMCTSWTDGCLESDSTIYNFEFLIVTDYCRNLETWLSIQRQFWKVYLLHLWIQLEKKGCCFAANLFLQLPRVNISAKTIPHRYIFSEWLYCRIAIIFGVQNTIDTSFVQQDFLPSLFRVKVFVYPASWCKRLPTRWWF